MQKNMKKMSAWRVKIIIQKHIHSFDFYYFFKLVAALRKT